MPVRISAHWTVSAALFIVHDAETTPNRVVTNTGDVRGKKAPLAFKGPSLFWFSDKTKPFWPNGLPQGFGISATFITLLVLLNLKKLQILVWDFKP